MGKYDKYKESVFTHEEMQPLKIEFDQFLESFPEDPDVAAQLDTLTREQVEDICTGIYYNWIEKMEKK